MFNINYYLDIMTSKFKYLGNGKCSRCGINIDIDYDNCKKCYFNKNNIILNDE